MLATYRRRVNPRIRAGRDLSVMHGISQRNVAYQWYLLRPRGICKFGIKRGQGNIFALRKFEVDGIIHRETVTSRKRKRGRLIGAVIDIDGELRQARRKALVSSAVKRLRR